MKTSIIVSTFAALCLMITFAETPNRRIDENNNVPSISNYSYSPTNLVYAGSVINSAASTEKKIADKTAVPSAADLSYLKFDVDGYMNENEMVTEAYAWNSFDYLKFDVNNYTAADEAVSYEAIELPANDFEYLKFNVNKFIPGDESNPAEITELPVDETSYMKFDVGKFMTDDDSNSSEISELSVDEYSYLKFDVTKYTDQNTTEANNLCEMPVSE